MEIQAMATGRKGPTYNTAPRAISQNAPTSEAKAEFARRLQMAMTKKGLNQAELARRASVHLPNNQMIRDSVSKYVRGLTLPSPNFLNALCRVLGTKPDELVPTRGVSTVGNENPPLDVRDIGDGMVWLKINQALEWPVALKIMEMLKGPPDGAN